MAWIECNNIEPEIVDITPSNASPVALVADNAVKPTTAGYAIESYASVTPRYGFPATMSANGIYKPSKNCVAVPTQALITPSNISPVQLSVNETYYPIIAGYAVETIRYITPLRSSQSVSSGDVVRVSGSGVIANPYIITPSNSSPVQLYETDNYEFTTDGYAIASYDSVTPSTSGVSFNSGMVKMSSSGYAYKTKQFFPITSPDVWARGLFEAGTSKSFTLTQFPHIIIVSRANVSSSTRGLFYTHFLQYDSDTSTWSGYYWGRNSDGGINSVISALPSYITSLTSSKLVMKNTTSSTNWQYTLSIWY